MSSSKAPGSDSPQPNRITELLRAAHFGWWELDLISQELTTSDSCKRNFGRPLDKPFLYSELVSAVYTEDFVHWRTTVETSITSGEVFDVEYRALCPDGEMRWIKVYGGCVSDPRQPELRLKMAGISRNTTAEKKGKPKAPSLDDSLERSRDFVAIFNLTGRPFYANQTALTWSGAPTLKAFCRRWLVDSFSRESQAKIKQELLPKVLASGLDSAELTLEPFDGKTAIPLHLNLSLLTADGRPIGFAAVGERR